MQIILKFLKKEFSNNSMKKGFTLIETLLVILLVGVASGAFLLGFAQAQLTLQSIKMKDRAHQELKQYTENIKSLVASGVQNFNSNQIGGIPVPIVSDASGQTIIEGNLYKDVRLCEENVCPKKSGDYSKFYKIHTWITWPESKRIFADKVEVLEKDLEKLEFTCYQPLIK